MEGPLVPRPGSPDPAQQRISDADRHHVAEILREAAGDGRIDLTELDERLEAAYAAKTYADLVPITMDLPAHVEATPVSRPTSAAPAERHVAIMSGLDRSGVWMVPQQLTVFAMMGGANLDLRRATFAAKEVVIVVNAFMGGAEITVNQHTNVIMEGVGIMGGYAGPSDRVAAELTADSPTVRVKGVAIWGGVSVTRKAV